MLRNLSRLSERRSWKGQLGRRIWCWLLVFAAFALIHDWGLVGSASTTADETPAENVEATAAPGAETGDAADEEHGDDHEGGGHADPVAPVLLAIVLILLLAKVGGDLFERIGMPAVLGELVVGIVLGNFALLTGSHALEFFEAPEDSKIAHLAHKIEAGGKLNDVDHSTLSDAGDQWAGMGGLVERYDEGGIDALTEEDHAVLKAFGNRSPYNTGAILKMLAGIGVVLLLFEVGLESTVREMMSVGMSSFIVAILGVVAPMGLGYAVSWMLIPEEGWQVWCFIGATLCATSVGITARVLQDLGQSKARESQIILGAAVIDDVLGLVVLAVVSGVIQTGSVDPTSLTIIICKAFGFLVGAVFLGTQLFTRPIMKAASFLRGHGLLVVSSLVICFGFSWLANFFGLAPIVGAFAAGLILEQAHYKELSSGKEHELEDALAPITALLVPIFFVQMGIQVNLASFSDPSVWGLAAAITVVAVIGKQVCAFGVREPGLNRGAVGLGMIPRGEVGLIFADVGRGLMVKGEPVIGDSTFSAVVVMVMVTTMVTPPLLKWSMSKGSSSVEGGETGAGDDAPTDESAEPS
ncbi:MAG: sodium:proton antiporter [Planctomycetaceae bacterium]|nr:sodium:proton antiporter [Planctomycetaceae bacterium]